jgi:integrase
VLRPFFGQSLLRDITIADMRRYQDERSKKAGAYLLNSELGVVQMILREARLCFARWRGPIVEQEEACSRPRGSSKEEEDRLRTVAFSKAKWRLAAHCMTIMLSTTMGFGELRQLRRRDVDMQRRCVTVREGAKNEFRERTIPLNATAYESMTWILARWKKLGGNSDEHYILPHRPKGERASHWRRTIPACLDEPMTSIHGAFNRIRREAGLPKFRIYDCRVQAITKLLSHPEVSAQVSKEIAGHISQAMQNRYSKQQFETKRAALETLENPSSPAPSESGPPTPPSGGVLKPAELIQPAIQAEIDRLKEEIGRLPNRSMDLGSQEHSPAQPKTHARRRRKTKSVRTGSSDAVFFERTHKAKNLIVFPNRSA